MPYCRGADDPLTRTNPQKNLETYPKAYAPRYRPIRTYDIPRRQLCPREPQTSHHNQACLD